MYIYIMLLLLLLVVYGGPYTAAERPRPLTPQVENIHHANGQHLPLTIGATSVTDRGRECGSNGGVTQIPRAERMVHTYRGQSTL